MPPRLLEGQSQRQQTRQQEDDLPFDLLVGLLDGENTEQQKEDASGDRRHRDVHEIEGGRQHDAEDGEHGGDGLLGAKRRERGEPGEAQHDDQLPGCNCVLPELDWRTHDVRMNSRTVEKRLFGNVVTECPRYTDDVGRFVRARQASAPLASTTSHSVVRRCVRSTTSSRSSSSCWLSPTL